MAHLVGFAVVFLLLAVLLSAVERRWGRLGPRCERSARERRGDVLWWFFGAVVNEPLRRATAIAIALSVGVPVLLALDLPVSRVGFKALLETPWGLGRLPLWLGAPLTLLLLDLAGYWIHRLKHRGGLLWRVHAVHHSSERLDWLAAARAHPLDEVATVALAVVPVVLLGARPTWLAPIAPLLALWAIVLHADVPFRLGPLGAVLASPAFHRWHHAANGPRPAGVNFGGFFTVWDRLFGTFHLPAELPAETGVRGEPVPEGWLAQLWHPFSGRSAEVASRGAPPLA